jgi:succinoglycan biosynthesis protein ExoA
VSPSPRVSVIAPMWNEAAHIEEFVADIAAQDYEGALELLVADGRSTDGSGDLLRAAAERAGIAVTVLDNPSRWVSAGLNACIRAATGELIIRVDCHSRYPADYVRRCVIASQETGADNVGGVFVPAGRTGTERAVGVAMDSPFGGVHWTRHGSGERVEVDTVPYGAFRADVFDRIGYFDETLVRNQDDEFNLRLRLAGGKIVLDPAIRIYYTPRGSFRRLFRQYFEYGLWKPAVMRKHGRVVSARSLAPIFFVVSLAVLGTLAVFSASALILLAVEDGIYVLGALVFAVLAIRARRERWSLLPRVVAAFLTFHVAYGLGMTVGWLRVALGRHTAPETVHEPGDVGGSREQIARPRSESAREDHHDDDAGGRVRQGGGGGGAHALEPRDQRDVERDAAEKARADRQAL